MYFKPLTIVSIAAILSSISAAPLLPEGDGCGDAGADVKCYGPKRSANPIPATVTAPLLATIIADSGGYLKRSVNDDKIVIGSKKRSPQPKLPTLKEDISIYTVDEEWPVDEDWPTDDGYGEDESWPTDEEEYEKRSISSKKRSPQPKLPTLKEDISTYGEDDDWPIDEDWPTDDGYGEDESWPTDEEEYEKRSTTGKKRSPQPKLPTLKEDISTYGEDDDWPIDEDWPTDDGYGEDESWPTDEEEYEKRSLVRDPLPTGDDEGYLRRTKSKRSPMFPDKTCGPEEDLACYPDGSNGKRSPAPGAADDEIQPQPLPPGKRSPQMKQPIDGDYPPPNDDSYPVKAKRGPMPKPPPADAGDWAPPDNGYPVKAKREPEPKPEPPLDAGDYGGVGIDGFYLAK